MTQLPYPSFEALKPKASEARKALEGFPTPLGVRQVTMTSDEVTSLCPITNQPDFETVVIVYVPRERCLESKSLKLYFQALRNEGAFIESLSSSIARDVAAAIEPESIEVTATQKARGGISISSTALFERDEDGTYRAFR